MFNALIDDGEHAGMHPDVKRGHMRNIILPIIQRLQPESAEVVADAILRTPLEEIFPLFSFDQDLKIQYSSTKRSIATLEMHLAHTLEAMERSN